MQVSYSQSRGFASESGVRTLAEVTTSVSSKSTIAIQFVAPNSEGVTILHSRVCMINRKLGSDVTASSTRFFEQPAFTTVKTLAMAALASSLCARVLNPSQPEAARSTPKMRNIRTARAILPLDVSFWVMAILVESSFTFCDARRCKSIRVVRSVEIGN